ncbi:MULTISPECIES: DUF3019 domain-containing protein [Pseudoalteromonas]|uniref:Uncharacterized protein n=2 Tax=Pseudoalteromonas TaxID=53246 RepID=A0A4Q7E6U5_9GAMM|nr:MULTISPECIES: DUF3019 domain-containing protein [Pseudoalteromonas]QTL34175.1 DUF3019 domain-containing protein [Pseudoalteromonas viridis]RZM78100.1 hypothetical protein C3B51_15620 [Pseudoalteromonas rubra]
MYFKFTSAMTIGVFCMASAAHAAVNDDRKGILQVAPNKCVALHEGRTCYADVTFSISAPQVGDYCIRDSNSKKILQCWANVSHFEYLLAFGSAQSVSYELISKSKRDVLAVTTINVNWVHKVRNKKRRWQRLF